MHAAHYSGRPNLSEAIMETTIQIVTIVGVLAAVISSVFTVMMFYTFRPQDPPSARQDDV
jgi:hypothetical protein